MKDDIQQPSRGRHVSEVSCAHVRQLLQEWKHSDTLSFPSSALSTHVVRCHLCQGSLLALIAEVAQRPTSALITDGQKCFQDLPAFIDQELADAHVALRLYPHVWWHLWICEECAETYRFTRVLVEAEQSGDLLPPPFPVPVASIRNTPQPVLRASRRIIAAALPTIQSLVVARGSDDESFVVAMETDQEGREISLRVQQQASGTWRVIVEAVPPVKGQLALTIDELSFQASFNPQGLATIPDLPTSLLNVADGPDVVARITLDG